VELFFGSKWYSVRETESSVSNASDQWLISWPM
jgi:hypothetical protein